MDKKMNEVMEKLMAGMGPAALRNMRELLNNPATPTSARVQMIDMILERTMGKPEETMRLLMEKEDREAAEERMAEIIRLAKKRE
jgi:F0F1-type ATP synthase delta subunit